MELFPVVLQIDCCWIGSLVKWSELALIFQIIDSLYSEGEDHCKLHLHTILQRFVLKKIYNVFAKVFFNRGSMPECKLQHRNKNIRNNNNVK